MNKSTLSYGISGAAIVAVPITVIFRMAIAIVGISSQQQVAYAQLPKEAEPTERIWIPNADPEVAVAMMIIIVTVATAVV